MKMVRSKGRMHKVEEEIQDHRIIIIIVSIITITVECTINYNRESRHLTIRLSRHLEVTCPVRINQRTSKGRKQMTMMTIIIIQGYFRLLRIQELFYLEMIKKEVIIIILKGVH